MNNIYEDSYNERIKLTLPRYTKPYPEYDDSSEDGCILFTLFSAYEGVIPTYHINSAFWAMHAFFVNSNVLSLGIPIKFYIGRDLWDNASIRKRFSDANIPARNILLFDKIETLVTRRNLGQKLACMWDNRLAAYDAVAVVDSDCFISTRHQDEYFDINRVFDIKDRSIITSSLVRDTPKRPRLSEWDLEPRSADAWERWRNVVLPKAGLEHLADNDYCLGMVGGWLYIYDPNCINPEFVAFYKDMLSVTGDDEEITWLWSLKSGEKIQTQWRPSAEADETDIRVASYLGGEKRQGVLQERAENYDFFWAHVFPGDTSEYDIKEATRLWRHVIGQHKEIPDGYQ